jgi:hypothetical protein
VHPFGFTQQKIYRIARPAFLEGTPNKNKIFILNANEPEELATYLKQQKWLEDGETIVSC